MGLVIVFTTIFEYIGVFWPILGQKGVIFRNLVLLVLVHTVSVCESAFVHAQMHGRRSSDASY
jgi:hypothetical protein